MLHVLSQKTEFSNKRPLASFPPLAHDCIKSWWTCVNSVNSIVHSFPIASTAAWVCCANFKPIKAVEQLGDLSQSGKEAKGVI